MHEDRELAVRARAAVAADMPEILRLVAQVYWDMHALYGGPEPETNREWERRVRASVARRLGDDVAIFVVDGVGGKLGSVAVGRISESLPSPRRSHSLEGYIEWVGTDPQLRRRGFATAATQELLNWFREKNALSVSLNASKEAESLYLNLGFDDAGPRSLGIRLNGDQP